MCQTGYFRKHSEENVPPKVCRNIARNRSIIVTCTRIPGLNYYIALISFLFWRRMILFIANLSKRACEMKMPSQW